MGWAKATCTCEKCGCTFHPQKECYNSTKAAQWEEWAADHITVCPECEEKDRREQTQIAREIAEAAQYPALKGSERQIEWALCIREKKADALEDMRDRALARMKNCPEKTESCQRKIRAIERIMAQDTARWWIDTRADEPKTMVVKAIMEENAK